MVMFSEILNGPWGLSDPKHETWKPFLLETLIAFLAWWPISSVAVRDSCDLDPAGSSSPPCKTTHSTAGYATENNSTDHLRHNALLQLPQEKELFSYPHPSLSLSSFFPMFLSLAHTGADNMDTETLGLRALANSKKNKLRFFPRSAAKAGYVLTGLLLWLTFGKENVKAAAHRRANLVFRPYPYGQMKLDALHGFQTQTLLEVQNVVNKANKSSLINSQTSARRPNVSHHLSQEALLHLTTYIVHRCTASSETIQFSRSRRSRLGEKSVKS